MRILNYFTRTNVSKAKRFMEYIHLYIHSIIHLWKNNPEMRAIGYWYSENPSSIPSIQYEKRLRRLYTIERTHSLSSTRESHRDVVSDRDKQHRGWHLSVSSEVTGGYDDEETLTLQKNHTCHKVHSATLYLDAQKGTIRAIHA